MTAAAGSVVYNMGLSPGEGMANSMDTPSSHSRMGRAGSSCRMPQISWKVWSERNKSSSNCLKVGFGCCSIHSGVQGSGQYQGSVGWLGREGPEGWGLGTGRRRLWPLCGRGPYTKWKEDCQARPCSSILCPPFRVTYRGRSKVSLEEAGWAGPQSLPLPLPLPFFVNVYLTLPSWKSIYYLPGRPEGQQMKLPVTRTSFRPKLSQYLQG